MKNAVRCKRILNGKTYNTETAALLGWHSGEDSPFEEALFKTRHGVYFLYSSNDADLAEEINPLDAEAAQQWMEQCCRPELVEAEFGEMPEAGDPEARFTLRMPETLRRRLATLADTNHQSLNAWIMQRLERLATQAETAE